MTTLEHVVAASQKLGKKTRDMYLRRVQAYVEFAGKHPHNWTMASLEAWRDHLLRVQGLKPKTINVYMAAVFFASRRLGERGEGEHFARGAERIRVAVDDTPNEKALTVAQCRQLLASCSGDDPPALRDRAMILLAIHAAFRREELCTVLLTNVTRRRVTVLAKGEKLHTVQIDVDEAWEALQAWMAWLRRHGVNDGRVFRSLRASIEPEHGGWRIGRGLTGDGFTKILKARGDVAGIEGLHPHALRHTYATLATEAGVPRWKIEKVLGHRAPSVTARYVSTYDEPSGATLPKLT